VSVDTNTKGKNLSPYKAMRAGEDLQVLITPTLAGLASRMRVTTRGGLRKKLSVELSDGRPQSDDSCEI
jgi:hypothetical protein